MRDDLKDIVKNSYKKVFAWRQARCSDCGKTRDHHNVRHPFK